MQVIRLALLLLLSLALPINGMAQMVLPTSQGWAMQHDHAEMSMAMHADKAAITDDAECLEHDASGKSSAVCKSGQECKTSSLLQVSLGRAPLLPLGQQVSVHPSDIAPALIPDAVWHPPRA